MRSCYIPQGTMSSHMRWNMMEDNVRKIIYICVCVCILFAVQYDWITLLYNRKLTEHCKPTIMEKIKIIKFKK